MSACMPFEFGDYTRKVVSASSGTTSVSWESEQKARHSQAPVGVEHQVVERDELLKLFAEAVLELRRPTESPGVALQVARERRLVIVVVKDIGARPAADAGSEAQAAPEVMAARFGRL